MRINHENLGAERFPERSLSQIEAISSDRCTEAETKPTLLQRDALFRSLYLNARFLRQFRWVCHFGQREKSCGNFLCVLPPIFIFF